jgi:hypothetical protein
VKRLAVIALALVHRGVSNPTQIVEERPLRRSDDVALEEPVDQLLLTLLLDEETPPWRPRAARVPRRIAGASRA